MLYRFELSHNTAEATQNICSLKGKGAADHTTITKWFKEPFSDCKNFHNQTRLVLYSRIQISPDLRFHLKKHTHVVGEG